MNITLNFISLLNKEELIDLLNYCVNDGKHIINEIVIYNETERRNIKGNYYIEAFNTKGQLHISDYNLSDDELISLGFLNHSFKNNYSDKLHEFLAIKFGTNYTSFLYNRAMEKANNEKDKLVSLITAKGNCKKRTYTK